MKIVVRDAQPADEQPEQRLWRWQIVTTPNGDRRFCGFRSEHGGGDGRVSSRIVEYDAASQVGKTESGRTYRLQGPSSDLGLEVWRLWSLHAK